MTYNINRFFSSSLNLSRIFEKMKKIHIKYKFSSKIFLNSLYVNIILPLFLKKTNISFVSYKRNSGQFKKRDNSKEFYDENQIFMPF